MVSVLHGIVPNCSDGEERQEISGRCLGLNCSRVDHYEPDARCPARAKLFLSFLKKLPLSICWRPTKWKYTFSHSVNVQQKESKPSHTVNVQQNESIPSHTVNVQQNESIPSHTLPTSSKTIVYPLTLCQKRKYNISHCQRPAKRKYTLYNLSSSSHLNIAPGGSAVYERSSVGFPLWSCSSTVYHRLETENK